MLEDYALCVQGLLTLYQEDFDPQWFALASEMQAAQDAHFTGLGNGKRYSLSPVQNSPLPPRQDFTDGDLPSPQAMVISNLLTLNALSQDPAQLKAAEKLLLAVGDAVVKSPLVHSQYLMALDQYMDSQTLVVTVPGGNLSDAVGVFEELGRSYFPHCVFAAAKAADAEAGPAVLKGKDVVKGETSMYVLGSEGEVEGEAFTSVEEAKAALSDPCKINFA